MEIELNRDQARELQNLCLDIISKENELKALEILDSSRLRTEAKLNHSLIKLLQSIKGNKHNANILALAIKIEDELSIVKDKFEIDKNFIPALLSAAHNEYAKMSKIIDSTKKEIPYLHGYARESQEKYIDVVAKRKEYLVQSTEKLNERISIEQKKKYVLDAL